LSKFVQFDIFNHGMHSIEPGSTGSTIKEIVRGIDQSIPAEIARFECARVSNPADLAALARGIELVNRLISAVPASEAVRVVQPILENTLTRSASDELERRPIAIPECPSQSPARSIGYAGTHR
jgi:hypothetical protein